MNNDADEREDENKPSPCEWVALKEYNPKHRNIWCKHYGYCLSRAIREGWRGWSCYRCKLKDKRRTI